MAFTVAIAQPTGVGSAVGTKGLSGAWLDEPVIITLPAAQYAYEVSVVDESTGVGAVLTGEATAAAQLTAEGKGSVRLWIRYRATSVSRWEQGYRVVRFQRDADGQNLETVAPALLESPAETAEARGYAEIMDQVVAAAGAANAVAERNYEACRAVITSGAAEGLVHDGVTLTAGQRVLRAVGAESGNGIFIAAAGAHARAPDMPAAAVLALGGIVPVLEGSASNVGIWRMSAPTSGTVTVGTTAMGWEAPETIEPFDGTPAPVGTAAAGDSALYARGNHAHAHGSQLGGALHANAVASGDAGFQTGADKAAHDANTADLAAATSAATAGAIARRAAVTAALAAGPLTAPSLVAASGGLALGDTGQTSRVLGSVCTVQGADIRCANSAATDYIKLDFASAAAVFRMLDGLSSFSFAWEQRVAGAGKVTTIEGQQGQAGFIGGDVIIRAGLGGTAGTNAGGNVYVDLAQQAGGLTSHFGIRDNGTEFFFVHRIGAIGYIQGNALNLYLAAASGGFTYTGTGSFQALGASGMFFDAGLMRIRTAASATKLSLTVADAFVIDLASGVSCDFRANTASRFKINATGVAWFSAAAVAQQADAGAITDNTAGVVDGTLQALPDPADAPATADALRDDLVNNLIPALRNDLADLADKYNALRTLLRTYGLMA